MYDSQKLRASFKLNAFNSCNEKASLDYSVSAPEVNKIKFPCVHEAQQNTERTLLSLWLWMTAEAMIGENMSYAWLFRKGGFHATLRCTFPM